MNEPASTANVPTQPLQFDTAQFGSNESLVGELSCSACQQPLVDTYYEVNGHKVCQACTNATMNARAGSGFVRFIRAGLFGLIAGAAGCGIYYAVLALTGFEVGLIAILVGLMVGVAVRNGSGHRGGWLYQGMAMLITYGSIVSSYVPQIVQELRGNQEEGVQVPMAIVAVFAWVAAWFAPFLSLPGNIIGVAIIAFGVYEAWQLNKRQPLEVSGPYNLAASASPQPVAAPAVPYANPSS